MKRSEIDNKYKWDLSAIIADDAAWEKLFSETKKEMGAVERYNGKLSDRTALLSCLTARDKYSLALEKLYVYAKMKKDQDVTDQRYKGLSDRAGTLAADFSALASFITPQLSALPDETLRALILDKDLSGYDYYFSEILREKAHILPEEAEKVMALCGDFSGAFSDVFGMIDNAELPFKKVDDGTGKKVKLTHGLYSTLLQNPDKKIRAAAFKANYAAYESLINTIAATYGGSVKKDVFYARARKYGSCIEEALEGDDVPKGVYDNLVAAVHENLKPLHRYVAYRNKVLGEKEGAAGKPYRIHMYDMYVPLVDNADIKLSYEDAYALTMEGLKPLGAEYQDLLRDAFKNGWIDVFETDNKRSGAYSWGAYGSHPYVLLNFQKTTHDVFTIAHEMGHAIHSYYSDRSQPFPKAGYRIFVAEVASTVNEMLLLKHLIKKADADGAKSAGLKKYLLTYYLDMFRTTLFRQTMFAEFEMISHGFAERGEPLTVETLSKEYYRLNKKYYGNGVIHDKQIRLEWARIPHFYNSFYVYKYATGITAAAYIAGDILQNGAKAVERYKQFLCAGGSKGPYEILKDTGADLKDPAVYAEAMKGFCEALSQLEDMG